MKKTVKFGGKPPSGAKQVVDEWVQTHGTAPAEPTKRLTIDVPVSLHKRIKTACVLRDVIMADEIRDLLDKHFPPS